MEIKNVGFVGFGFIGKVHAYGYINLPLHYQSLPFNMDACRKSANTQTWVDL